MRISDVLAKIPLLEEALRHSDDQHTAIARAVGRRDDVAARELMVEHISATATLLRGFLA